MELELFVPPHFAWSNFINKTDENGNTIVFEVNEVDESDMDSILYYAINSCSTQRNILLLNNEVENNLTTKESTKAILDLMKNVDFDLLYLSRYCDLKQAHENKHEINGRNVVKIKSPHGIDALIISKNCISFLRRALRGYHGRGLDFTLNAMCEKLNAYSYENPLFIYKNIKEQEYKLKLYRDPEISKLKPKVNIRNQSSFNLFWFFLSIFIIILCIFDFLLFVVDQSYSDEETLERYKDCEIYGFDLMYLVK